MEEYIANDGSEASPRSGGVGSVVGGSGIESAGEPTDDARPQEPGPQPPAAAADAETQPPSSPVIMKDDASAEHHGGGADEDMDEDSPVFLAALSHTTESDAIGEEAPEADDVAADDATEVVEREAAAIAAANDAAKGGGNTEEVGPNPGGDVALDASADLSDAKIEKRHEDDNTEPTATGSIEAPAEKDATDDGGNKADKMELEDDEKNNVVEGGGGIAKQEKTADIAGVDQMDVDDDADEGHLLNPPSAEATDDTKEINERSSDDPAEDAPASEHKEDDDPAAEPRPSPENDLTPMQLEMPDEEVKVKKSPTLGTAEGGVLQALEKMIKPTEATGRKTSKGRPACALDGCDKQEQGILSNFFCKRHCRMWKEANRKAKSDSWGGAPSSLSPVVADAPARSARKRKQYDEGVVVGGKGPVTEEVSMRSSKRGRKKRDVAGTQHQPLGDSHEDALQAALRLSIEEKVKSSPRKAGAASLSAVSHSNKTRKSTRTNARNNADRPSLVNQVVRLTAKGREEVGDSMLIQGIDPQLYFVLNYNSKKNQCELVPMRIVGRFRAKECQEFPQSRGREKWMLYSEKECKGQGWDINGNLLEVVQATTIANTPDADTEQWDVLKYESVPMTASYDEAAELTQTKDVESKPPAKFSLKLSVYAKEDDGLFYKAKVKKRRYNEEQGLWEYELHFLGWAAKYDRWVPEEDVVRELPPGEVAGPIPNSSPAMKKAMPKTSSTTNTKSNQGDISSASTSTGTSIYAKCSSSSNETGSSGPTPAQGDEMLQVDRILGRRWNVNSRQIELLTVWSGFSDPSEYTWEPESNFSLQSLAIFRQMWGEANDPPYDGEAEMLSGRDVRKMKKIQDGVDSKSTSSRGCSEATTSSTKASTTVISSNVLPPPSSPNSAARRSTRTRATVLNPSGIGLGEGGEKQETTKVEVVQTKSTRQGHSSVMSPPQSAAGVVWTPVNECILLLTALEHPEDLVAEGPGLWMVTKSDWLFEGFFPTTDRQVRHHFEDMLRRKCDRLVDNSALDYGRHVLNFSLASAPPSAAAKNLALVAAGWFRIAGGSGLNCSKATWHRPLLDLKGSYCRLSEKQTKELAVSLDLAWQEHEQTIRDAIEEAWVPTIKQGEAIRDEDVVVDEEEVAEQDGGDNGHDKREEAVHLDEPADTIGRVVMEGIEPPQKKSHERDDWAKYSRLLKERKKITKSGDPRPSLTCRWCGVRPFDVDCYEAKTTAQFFEYRSVPATCKACKYLEELGWRFNFTVKILSEKKRKAQNRKGISSIKAISPDGKSVESVKEFLRISTLVVSKEFIKNHALNTPSTPVGRIDQGRSPKPSSKVAPATSSAVDEAKQKGEDNNQEGDAPMVSHKMRPKTTIMKPVLPTFKYLLQLERGLVTVLTSDDLHYWNAYYGSNSTVALCTLRPLATGKLPRAVQSETPFFRPRDELNVMSRKGGAPPTRFLGVSRTVEPVRSGSSVDEPHRTGNFGVEFPLFEAKTDPLVPQSATIKSRTVLIRNDLTEDVAGRLYAFMFRLLYGTAAVERMLQKTNSLAENASFVQDTLRAFGAAGEVEEGAS